MAQHANTSASHCPQMFLIITTTINDTNLLILIKKINIHCTKNEVFH